MAAVQNIFDCMSQSMSVWNAFVSVAAVRDTIALCQNVQVSEFQFKLKAFQEEYLREHNRHDLPCLLMNRFFKNL